MYCTDVHQLLKLLLGYLLVGNYDRIRATTDITRCVSSSTDMPDKSSSHIHKAIFMVKRMLSKEEIILDALWHQYLCASLLLSANVRRQSLHLAVHCKPDCPSHCPVPVSPCCNPKTCTGQQLASYPAPPHPSLSIVLCPLSPPGSLICLTGDICESD